MNGCIACFTNEIAVSQDLHTYSGGLGVVMGSFARSCERLGLPIVFMTILPRRGYYDQGVDKNERVMTVNYRDWPHERFLRKTDARFTIPICGKPVWLEAWELPKGHLATPPIYFLDADVEGNDHLSRCNTMWLYGGNMETMIGQSLILGRGGVEALKRLNIPVGCYHINESSGVFALLELLATAIEGGMDQEQAIASVRSQAVFTTHTPVIDGNSDYSMEVVMRFTGYKERIGQNLMKRLGGDGSFNMTSACLQLSSKANAVSRKHLRTAQRMWAWVREAPPLFYITNGKDPAFWQDAGVREAKTWQELRAPKNACHDRMREYVARDFGYSLLNHETLTLVWARRFARYKRPWLLFNDPAWLEDRLRRNVFQLIIAGKPHPADTHMINTWNWIYRLSLDLPNLIVLPGYELEMMRLLQAGTHLWVNTPASPWEGCGSSGMGAAQNGGIHLSTPDGWACEQDQENALICGTSHPLADQDVFDSQALTRTIDYAAQVFYGTPMDWWIKGFHAKEEAETQWSSDRMARQYAELLYGYRLSV